MILPQIIFGLSSNVLSFINIFVRSVVSTAVLWHGKFPYVTKQAAVLTSCCRHTMFWRHNAGTQCSDVIMQAHNVLTSWCRHTMFWRHGAGTQCSDVMVQAHNVLTSWCRHTMFCPQRQITNAVKCTLLEKLKGLIPTQSPTILPLTDQVRHSDSNKNCTLLSSYAVTSANYLSTFKDSLSVPSSNGWRCDAKIVPKRRQLSTNLRSVTTQKSEHLMYTVATARNHTCHVWPPLQILAVKLAAGCLEHVEVAVVSCGVRRGKGRPQEV